MTRQLLIAIALAMVLAATVAGTVSAQVGDVLDQTGDAAES